MAWSTTDQFGFFVDQWLSLLITIDGYHGSVSNQISHKFTQIFMQRVFYFRPILTKYEYARLILLKPQNIKLHENASNGSQVVLADSQTSRS